MLPRQIEIPQSTIGKHRNLSTFVKGIFKKLFVGVCCLANAFYFNKYRGTIATGRKCVVHASPRISIFGHDLRRIAIVPAKRPENWNDDAGRNGAFVWIKAAIKAGTYAVYKTFHLVPLLL